MHDGTKHGGKGGRPRKFNEDEALARMQQQLWHTGLSGSSLDSIARSAGLNRPSLAAAFGDRNAIYNRAASLYAAMMEERLGDALAAGDLAVALEQAFCSAIDIYSGDGPRGCLVICTAPAEALANPLCRDILGQSLEAIDALFLRRLQQEYRQEGTGERRPAGPAAEDLPVLASLLASTLQGLALRARAGWSRDRLQHLAAATVGLVVASCGDLKERDFR